MTNEEIFEENIMIAYKIANRYRTNYFEELEDIKQIALMELWRCIMHWDHIHALTTYAYICIPTKINMYLRKIKKYKTNNLSLDTTVYSNKDGMTFSFEDMLDNDIDCIDFLIDNLDAQGVLDKIYLTDDERYLIELRMRGLPQKQCAKILKKSQPQISRDQTRIKKKISNYINGGKKIIHIYKEDISLLRN